MIKTFKVTGLPRKYCKDSVFWNWDNSKINGESEAPRRFAVLGTKYTNSNTTIIVVIERATEALCNEEMDGQLSDGYFEDVPYNYDFKVDYYVKVPQWVLDVYNENMPDKPTN